MAVVKPDLVGDQIVLLALEDCRVELHFVGLPHRIHLPVVFEKVPRVPVLSLDFGDHDHRLEHSLALTLSLAVDSLRGGHQVRTGVQDKEEVEIAAVMIRP